MSGLAALPALASAGGVEPAQAPRPPAGAAPVQAWDLSWLDSFKGKHKQLFDMGGADVNGDSTLRMPSNYLAMAKEVLNMEPPDVNVVIGIQQTAFPFLASDALWPKFKLGELWKINDPQTRQPAQRNIFLGQKGGNPANTVVSLQERGAIFWQCNMALFGVAATIAQAVGRPMPEVRSELIAGFVPGVKLVPAHTLLVGLVQERGFTYQRV
jgi:hypothetical protein